MRASLQLRGFWAGLTESEEEEPHPVAWPKRYELWCKGWNRGYTVRHYWRRVLISALVLFIVVAITVASNRVADRGAQCVRSAVYTDQAR